VSSCIISVNIILDGRITMIDLSVMKVVALGVVMVMTTMMVVVVLMIMMMMIPRKRRRRSRKTALMTTPLC